MTHILIVDDAIEVRQLTAELLESEGFSVSVAHSGANALDRLRNDPSIALILTDVRMEGMDGFELAAAARQARPDLAVVYVSGYADNPDYKNRETFGPVLQKPVLPDDLNDAIRSALGKGR